MYRHSFPRIAALSQKQTAATAFLAGGGKMGRQIASHDWAATPLGPIEDWPAVLKITVGTMVNSAFPKCLCWGEDLTMIYNDAFVPILDRKHPCLGMPFLSVWAEGRDTIGPIADRAMAGHSTFIEDFPLETNRSGTFDTAHFTFCYSPVRDETGAVCGMLDTVVETTGKVKAEKFAALRNHELVHRSRNAYALVSALVNQTFRGSGSLHEIRDELQRRIGALVRAQDLLIEGNSTRGTLELVARRALHPFLDDPRRFEFRGPALSLGREQVTTLSLSLHELATNSVKYGALGSAEGSVLVAWDLTGSDGALTLRLTWRERDGPEVVEPKSKGFGSRLIRQTLPASFSGKVDVDYAPDGLRVTLVADATRLVAEDQLAAE
ncbi:Two-component sensor histidine kinase, contains HisKA and HATPase domains [Tranquillimonas rosea]|uniref:histidine kinase n=1 Tax=Tranquillimonas rosea TaxID=641238 RepID=A0A1H9WPR0_9RHOB|nr:Two-component sensor histidine kinase, contains HisKA and HATPase domains [Tranquillimonas rosea]